MVMSVVAVGGGKVMKETGCRGGRTSLTGEI